VKKKNKISGRNIFQLAGDEKTNPYCEVNLNSIQLNDWNSLIESKQRKLRFAYSEIGRIAKKLLEEPNTEFKTELLRQLSQILFDCIVVFTNRASTKLVDKYGKDYLYDFFHGYADMESRVDAFKKQHGSESITIDHEWPRQKTAKILVEQFQEKEFDFTYFWEEWNTKYSFVNLVTTRENGVLNGSAKKLFINPKRLYEDCHIDLIDLSKNQ
tara:strand:+ start:69 stop:707 length:639 start_codon:yes stop_codon:yes gene_type:complete